MAYIPLAFSNLRENTLNLENKFSTLLGRYKIVDNVASSTTQNSLEVLIARANAVTKCNTKRIPQRDVFNQLILELRDVLKKGDDEEKKIATHFLLGALLHRYFRIIQECDNISTRFWVSKPTNSELFNAIRSTLQLDLNPSNQPITDFKAHDLKILDVTSIVSSLEVFRDNMLLPDENKIPRYKKYPHLEQDVNFTSHLNEIIDRHRQSGFQVLNQFKAIRFILSLVNQMASENTIIIGALHELGKVLASEHPDFNKLSMDAIKAQVTQTIKSDLIKKKLNDLLETPFIEQNLVTMNHKSFLEGMKNCHLRIASYTVFGGYALLLQSKVIDANLKYCIHEALGVEKKPNSISENDWLDGINFLDDFLKYTPEAVLDYDFFGGKKPFDTEISQMKLELSNKLGEEVVSNTV